MTICNHTPTIVRSSLHKDIAGNLRKQEYCIHCGWVRFAIAKPDNSPPPLRMWEDWQFGDWQSL